MTEHLQTDYLDRHEGFKAKIHQVSQFDESSVVSTTYSGKVTMTRDNVMKGQEQFSIENQSTIIRTLLDAKDCKILLDSDAIKSSMSKQYWLWNKYLHCLPKVAQKPKSFKFGNRASVNILFIPIHANYHYHSKSLWNSHHCLWDAWQCRFGFGCQKHYWTRSKIMYERIKIQVS